MGADSPLIQPLGDCAVLIRFADRLDVDANARAIGFARHFAQVALSGVTEIVPSLVSTLVRYDPAAIDYGTLTGELRLALSLVASADAASLTKPQEVPVIFGGEGGPDLEEVAHKLAMPVEDFVQAHNASVLRVMAVGFAPGFIYCGMHPDNMHISRRRKVRSLVPAGSILFAAGQTAIAATPIPTGWHVIGTTTLRNFTPEGKSPTVLAAGDAVKFVEAH